MIRWWKAHSEYGHACDDEGIALASRVSEALSDHVMLSYEERVQKAIHRLFMESRRGQQ